MEKEKGGEITREQKGPQGLLKQTAGGRQPHVSQFQSTSTTP